MSHKPVALLSGIPLLSHMVMTATYTDLPEPELVQPIILAVSATLSSSLLQGSSLSVMSPHLLGSMDYLQARLVGLQVHPPGQAARVLEDTWHMQCWEHQRGVCGSEGNDMHAVKHGKCTGGDIQLWVVVVCMCVAGMAVAASGWQCVRDPARTRL